MVWTGLKVFWLSKEILQAQWKEKRKKKGRQKKSREDNIKRRTRADFARSTRAAEDRTRCKGIVVKSVVVPQQGYGVNQTSLSLGLTELSVDPRAEIFRSASETDDRLFSLHIFGKITATSKRDSVFCITARE